MQHVVVFLGPSLDHETARKYLDATYLPPAKRSDITSAVDAGAEIIGLIDGVFFQSSAVGHREILYALKRGVRVVGASSMGALRAAEMDSLGMIGIGKVYRMYADGELISDDEVALVFDPELFIPLSEPLVNIRHGLACAEKDGIIDGKTAGRIITAAKSLYYPERTWRSVCSAAGDNIDRDILDRLLKYIEKRKPDLKRDDAIAALKFIAGIAGEH